MQRKNIVKKSGSIHETQLQEIVHKTIALEDNGLKQQPYSHGQFQSHSSRHHLPSNHLGEDH